MDELNASGALMPALMAATPEESCGETGAGAAGLYEGGEKSYVSGVACCLCSDSQKPPRPRPAGGFVFRAGRSRDLILFNSRHFHQWPAQNLDQSADPHCRNLAALHSFICSVPRNPEKLGRFVDAHKCRVGVLFGHRHLLSRGLLTHMTFHINIYLHMALNCRKFVPSGPMKSGETHGQEEKTGVGAVPSSPPG